MIVPRQAFQGANWVLRTHLHHAQRAAIKRIHRAGRIRTAELQARRDALREAERMRQGEALSVTPVLAPKPVVKVNRDAQRAGSKAYWEKVRSGEIKRKPMAKKRRK